MDNFWFGVLIVVSVVQYVVVWRLARMAERDTYARGGPGGFIFYVVFFMPVIGLIAWLLARRRHPRIDYIRATGRGRER